MKTTVSGTDDSGQRHVSQTATSSEAKLDTGTVTTSDQRIAYTTAQLHENTINSIYDPLIAHIYTLPSRQVDSVFLYHFSILQVSISSLA